MQQAAGTLSCGGENKITGTQQKATNATLYSCIRAPKTTSNETRALFLSTFSPPLMNCDRVTEHDHGEDYREELPGRADCRAHERTKASDGEVDEVLPQGGRQRQAQHVALMMQKHNAVEECVVFFSCCRQPHIMAEISIHLLLYTSVQPFKTYLPFNKILRFRSLSPRNINMAARTQKRRGIVRLMRQDVLRVGRPVHTNRQTNPQAHESTATSNLALSKYPRPLV